MQETVNRRGLVDTEVRAALTGEKLGRVADILINPEQGRIIGLVVRSGREGDWLVEDFEFNDGSLKVSKESMIPLDECINEERSVSVVNEIIGARVVTTRGTLLGRVSEAGFSSEGSLAIFRISRSFLHNLFRRGLLIKSNAPKSYLKDGTRRGARLIVPSEMLYGDRPVGFNPGFLSGRQDELTGYGLLTAVLLLALGLIGTWWAF